MGHGQISFVSFMRVGTLGTVTLCPGSRGPARNLKSSPNEPLSRDKSMSNNSNFVIAGGRIHCNQCRATSKRTHLQCRAPAMKGKAVCRAHGGLSTGPRTPEGRQRCAEARKTFGFESRAARAERALGMLRLREIEELAHKLGIMTGPRTPGRKPT